MTETKSHEHAKNRAAGQSGETEVEISGGRRLDALTLRRATEIERSGTGEGLRRAAQRLKASGAPQRVLQVPQKDMPKAVEAMKRVGIGGSIKNMGGTKSKSLPKK